MKPERGHRFNANKVLLDPHAKAIGRKVDWSDEMFAYRIGDPAEDLAFDDRDSAAFAPLAAVMDPAFTWGEDRPPQIPWDKTLIHEVHVKGFTKRMPGVPEELRGTYAGMASEPAIRHLKELGVTTVELLPVHHHANDRHLKEKGLSNYWGYNTYAFLAPEARYTPAISPIESVREFKMMVRALHAAGIEVILDVVYNHTAEGNDLGPTPLREQRPLRAQRPEAVREHQFRDLPRRLQPAGSRDLQREAQRRERRGRPRWCE